MKQIVLKHALEEAPNASDFEMIDVADPACPPGGVLVRNIYVSLDPYVGSRLRGRHMGEPAPVPGSGVITGACVGQVVKSETDKFKQGDYVYSMEGGWREFAPLKSTEVQKIDPDSAPLSSFMGPLGMPGLTAWAGTTQLAGVGEGDVFLVNAASGPVGATAGQIARAKGAETVIGIAGGPEKCALVKDEYRFDACLDYKTKGWQAQLDEYAPDGITVHFENVSDEMLAFAISKMRLYGRAILCGLAAHYHADGPPAAVLMGPIIGKRASLHGLVVYDFYDRWDKFRSEIAPLVKAGKIKVAEDRGEGLESAPELMERLVKGKNVGKAYIAIGPES